MAKDGPVKKDVGMVTATPIQTANFNADGGNETMKAPSNASDVDRELEHVNALMRKSLNATDQWPAHAASLYHLETGGSQLRARLALLSGMAFKSSSAHRIAAAAASELIHNASLVHDDLCDGDSERRGQPSVWKRDNRGVALCTGDLLLTAAFRAALYSDQPKNSLALVQLLTERSGQVIAGQSIELASRGSNDIDFQRTTHHQRLVPSFTKYLQATLAKTAPLIALPLEAAALGGNITERQCEQLQRFAEAVGLAYQIIDDLDDLDSPCSQHLQPDHYHCYHAWPRHWPVRPQQLANPASQAMRRATRHASAALSRGDALIQRFPETLGVALKEVLATLRRRLDKHQMTMAAYADQSSEPHQGIYAMTGQAL
ncbi:polyprenyl diphosphate synthase [Vreelandella andesensis]|uniref:Polyprenyl diphosphate synthase n=1 Tax=Vreelandella andesensis TaxID=447567 RepID=A0A3S0XQ53_9GAMM|nr:polyprenyl synthetase family protein [Halomonas andesensis]RUR27195.1 polyprenyl diphosphate synthase [Halomonas andesensis]